MEPIITVVINIIEEGRGPVFDCKVKVEIKLTLQGDTVCLNRHEMA
ncbi:hypothetical protein [Sphingobacterium luzhongxinii]|nr:hypothetical protein [Sphingobacterium sp. xlx-183]